MNRKNIFVIMVLIVLISGLNIYINSIKFSLDILKFMGLEFFVPLVVTMVTNSYCIGNLEEIKETKIFAYAGFFTFLLLGVSSIFLKTNMTQDVINVMFENSMYLEGASIEFSQGSGGTLIFTAIVFMVLIYASGKITSKFKKKRSV